MSRIFAPVLMLIVALALVGCRERATPTPLPATATATVAPPTTPTVEPTDASTATTTPDATATPEPVDIAATLATRTELSALLAALEEQALVEKFASPGPFTLFAPTDDAFAALPADTREGEFVLFDILLYHAIAGELDPEELASLETVTTMLGDELAINATGDALQLGDDLVGQAEIDPQSIKATNGIIYIVDRVLIPESAGQ